MITLKIRDQSGRIGEFRCQELLEVDGQPFQQTDRVAELSERVGFLEGRIAALFELFTEQVDEITLPSGAGDSPLTFTTSGA